MPHALTLTSDLGDQVTLASLAGSEQLGQPFSYSLRLLSKNAKLDLRKLLASSMTATLEGPNGYKRYFNGIVSEASQSGYETIADKSYATYAVRIVPKLWLLSRKVDCRIYKSISVPDLITKVLGEMGVDVQSSLSGTYPVRDYCVQYREDYLNFVSRLMEQEGIYYFFKHAAGSHKLVLADGLGAHSPTPKYETLHFLSGRDRSVYEALAVQEFETTRQIHTTKYSLEDYDPIKPRATQLGSETFGHMDDAHTYQGLESFDFPGDHQVRDDGQRYARVKVEALSVALGQYTASTNAMGVLTGALFKLADCPRPEINQEYLVTGSTVSLSNPAQLSGGSNGDDLMHCSFNAIASKHPFRSLPSAVRPVIVGLQTAVVCGSKDAEDIAVDKYGRVQVIFHWNKPDKAKTDVSCPVRVSTPWAGKQWGAVHIPRVGQEVVVSFLEGDPDRPLIVGSVYNADNMPPYDLPANMTQSGIKSRSHKGGGADNFNEIRFEDKKGSEEVFIHAEKDYREEAENDHFVDIKHDETMTVGNDRKRDVTGKETIKIGKTFELDVGEEITIKTGAASINMKNDGTITIKGKDITIDGSMSVTGKAGTNMKLGAGVNLDLKADVGLSAEGTAKAEVKGAILDLSGTAMAKLKGAITMIG